MITRPTSTPRTDTRLPSTKLFRSQRILVRIANRYLAGMSLHDPAEQGRLQIPILQHGGGLPQGPAIEQGEPRPPRIGVDPLEPVVGQVIGHGEQGRRLRLQEPFDMALVKDRKSTRLNSSH